MISRGAGFGDHTAFRQFGSDDVDREEREIPAKDVDQLESAHSLAGKRCDEVKWEPQALPQGNLGKDININMGWTRA